MNSSPAAAASSAPPPTSNFAPAAGEFRDGWWLSCGGVTNSCELNRLLLFVILWNNLPASSITVLFGRWTYLGGRGEHTKENNLTRRVWIICPPEPVKACWRAPPPPFCTCKSLHSQPVAITKLCRHVPKEQHVPSMRNHHASSWFIGPCQHDSKSL